MSRLRSGPVREVDAGAQGSRKSLRERAALDVRHLESERLRDRRRDVTAQNRAERLASGDPCTSREEERAVLRLRRQVAVRAAVVRGRDHLVALRLVDEVVAALGLEGQI